MRRVYTFFLGLTLLLVTPACLFKSPVRCHVPRVDQERIKNELGLTIRARILTSAEVKARFWGTDLESYGVDVISLMFINRGNHVYQFRPSYCSLLARPVEEMVPYFHYDTASRVCWLTIPALLFWWPGIPLFVVPYGLYWRSENQKITEQLHEMVLDNRRCFEVAPYEVMERYVFTPAPAQPSFTLSLFDDVTKELVTNRISFVAPADEAQGQAVGPETGG